MNSKHFYQEKSAYLTALLSSLRTCLRVCETLERHEESAPGGPNPDFISLKEMIEDASAATEALRNAVDKLG
jgi:hypothetical protein